MQKKVTIIGAGSVGATTAFALLTRGAASEVVLIDVNTDKALGEALDIKQATPFIDNCDIYAGSYADAVNSDVVIYVEILIQFIFNRKFSFDIFIVYIYNADFLYIITKIG